MKIVLYYIIIKLSRCNNIELIKWVFSHGMDATSRVVDYQCNMYNSIAAILLINLYTDIKSTC